MRAYATTLTALVVGALLSAAPSYALERRQFVNVVTEQLIEDTQVSVPCDDSHMSLVWWIPQEFWQVTFANDKTTSEADKKNILSRLKPYSIIAICQADISDFGAFRFYQKSEIENRLDLSITKKDGRLHKRTPMKEVDPDLKILLGMFTPILAAAIGDMGKNVHFYVLDDVASAGVRDIDPYSTGALNVRLATRKGDQLKATIELPLNSLYVPRRCPNGKEAHVTWKYCPWTGQKLPE